MIFNTQLYLFILTINNKNIIKFRNIETKLKIIHYYGTKMYSKNSEICTF